MAYFESQHSGADFRKRRIAYSSSITFPLHLHTSFEFLYVKEGEVTLGVEGVRYPLKAGDHALIPPNAVHEYITEQSSLVGIVIFRAEYLEEVYAESSSGVLRDPVIRSDEPFFSELSEVENDLLLFRSVLYRVAAAYMRNGRVLPRPERDSAFARRLSAYMEQHYAEPIDEERVAREMGYHPRYLSVLIRKNFGVSFCRLLNEYRVKTACTLLRRGEGSVTEIYLAVGFNSQTSFNRNFKAIMGVTPLSYKIGSEKKIGDHRM